MEHETRIKRDAKEAESTEGAKYDAEAQGRYERGLAPDLGTAKQQLTKIKKNEKGKDQGKGKGKGKLPVNSEARTPAGHRHWPPREPVPQALVRGAALKSGLL